MTIEHEEKKLGRTHCEFHFKADVLDDGIGDFIDTDFFVFNYVSHQMGWRQHWMEKG
jgi:hypothetical protein